MKRIYSLPFGLLLLISTISTSINAQNLLLKSGHIRLSATNPSAQMELIASLPDFSGTRYALVSFEIQPTEEDKKGMAPWIQLIQYVPESFWYASIKKLPSEKQLIDWKVKSVHAIQKEWKKSPELSAPNSISWALSGDGIKLQVFCLSSNENELQTIAQNIVSIPGVTLLEALPLTRSLLVQASFTSLEAITDIPFVYWIDAEAPPVETNNWVERTNHRVPMIDELSTYGLTGKGVVVGEWDGTGAANHIDYDARHVAMEPFAAGGNGNHATHVAGTVLGAGVRNPEAKGMAPSALLYSWNFGGNITAEMDSGAANQGIEITQNSYGYGTAFDVCSRRATYDGNSSALDQLVVKYPYLLHVFAAGNSRSSNCLSGGYGTVHSGYQAGKNTLVVAAVSRTDGNSSFHSYGPMKDGRIKPEISAVGVDVYSTFPNDNYQGGYNGTSMACPGTSGTAALIYEYYERTYFARPPAHLIKGLMCNGADDIGRPGPDFQFGFGRVNAGRSALLLKNDQFKFGSVTQNGVWMDSVLVGSTAAEFKVMLNWDDPQAAASASKTLINDLDLFLITPSGDTVLPWVCNAQNYTANASRIRDSLNNIEQVTIAAPDSGMYRLVVQGANVPSVSQSFSINWLIQDSSLYLTYPNGGEQMVPPSTTGTAQLIRWDAYGMSGNARLEYSTDSGATWNLIVSSVNVNNRQYSWANCPATVRTGRALVRISLGGRIDESDRVFSIFAQPSNPSGVVCDSQVHLSWSAVSGAANYKIWMHEAGAMRVIDSTSELYYTARGLFNDSTYWFAVSAVGADGAQGPRSWGVKFTPNGSNRPPRYVLEPRDTAVCRGNDLSFQVGLTGTASINYSWQYSDDKGTTWIPLGISNQATISISNPDTSLNRRLYRVEAINTCQSRDYSRAAELKVELPLSFSYADPQIGLCVGQDTVIEVLHNNENEPLAQWYYQTGPTSTPLFMNGRTGLPLHLNHVSEINEGYYSVRLENSCGLVSNSQNVFIEVRDSLKLNISGNDTLCIGQRATLIAAGTGGDINAYTFGWRSGNRSFNNAFAYTTPDTSEWWTVFVHDQCSEDTVWEIVYLPVREPLQLQVTGDTLICLGNASEIKAHAQGGRTQSYRYTWSNGLGNQAVHQVQPATSTWYTLQFEDQCSKAVLRDSVLISVRAPLSVRIRSDRDTVCHTEPFTVYTENSGGNSEGYSWNWGAGASGDSLTLSMESSGWIRVQFSDACTVEPASDSLWVPVRDPLNVDILGLDSICQTSGGFYIAMLRGGREQSMTYTWNGIPETEQFFWTPVRSDTLYLRVSDGCTPYAPIMAKAVHVFDSLRLNSGDLQVDICEGASYTLTFVGSGGKARDYRYSWNGNILSSESLVVGPSDTSEYVIVLEDGCTQPSAEISLVVRVRPNLALEAGPDTLICNGSEVDRKLLARGGLASGYRYFANGELLSGSGFNRQLFGNNQVIFRLEDGCSATPATDTVVFSVSDFSSNRIEIVEQRNRAIQFGGSKGPHTVSWKIDPETTYKENQLAFTYVSQQYGIIEVCRREEDLIGCADTVCMPLRVFDVFATSGFAIEVYPNPVKDAVQVKLSDVAGRIKMTLYTTDAKLLYELEEENYSNQRYIVPMHDLARGVYFLRIDANEEQKVVKLVKE